MFNKLNRVISFLLVAVSIISMGRFSRVSAITMGNGERMHETEYADLPDDAVVCYVLGLPVYKYEIDEYGIIHKDFSAELTSRASSGIKTGTLIYPHNNETITATMIQVYTGYSETNSIMYLRNSEAHATAQAIIDGTSKNYVILQALGAYGTQLANLAKDDPDMDLMDVAVYAGVAAAIGVVIGLDAATKTAIANEISETAGASGHVMFIKVNSKYGTFYTSSAWNGITVYKPCVYTDANSTITINSVNCSHGSLWG